MHILLELAHRQGFVTAAQARTLGVRHRELGRAVAGGILVHAAHGVYLVAGLDPTRTHAALTQAMLTLDPFGIASHQSALVLHGIATYRTPFDRAHVASPRDSSRVAPGIHHHVWRSGDVAVWLGDARAVEPALACIQVAARYGLAAGVVSMDAALRASLCTHDDLSRVVTSGRQRRGLAAARRAVELADGRAASPGESRLRLIVAAAPWAFDLQVNVGGTGEGYQVDLLVDDRVALEFDGEIKYEGADGRRALVAEKAREDWIRGQGYGFMRTVWRELDHPVTIQRTLHRHVVGARARRAA